MIYKTFLQRVKDVIIAEGWNLQYTDMPSIDFLSVRRGSKSKKAYKVKKHGHLLKAEVKSLQEYGRVHKMHILYVHESDGHEIRFVRLYPRTERCIN